jgi:phage shock protein PspC (stress-responsive transcriptional regulator)
MNQLHKNSKNKVLFGVCSGLSDSLGIDVSLIRIGFILGAIFSGSILFWIYLLLGIILPSSNE